ncbi:TRAP transporter substrate-binding protein DctP [Desulfobacula sp.]|uniref:TRAP transporter substrate-binding protein DctP n=1 Tax=Desulfobacula sp. TaxID=2593537 RepID=UPI002612FB28|nr:TRAP transporter substrate-binding protein DctP [Desulfobacula sp.]
MGKKFLKVISLTIMVTLFAISLASAKMTVKFSAMTPPDHPETLRIQNIAKYINDKTNGEINVRVFLSNQLGDYVTVYDELIRGSIEMACISVPSHLDPKLQILYVPFMTTDYKQNIDFYAKGNWLFTKFEQINNVKGIKVLGFDTDGLGGLGLAKQPAKVLDPTAKQNILIRVPGMEIAKTIMEGMGYNTVSVPWADLYSALQTGVADGWYGGTPTINYLAFRDAIKYYYQLNIYNEAHLYAMSNKFWNKLTDEQKKIFEVAVAAAQKEAFETCEAADAEYLKKMTDEGGVQVFTYTAEDLAPMADYIRKNTWPKLAKMIGEDLFEELKENLGIK